jgi:hypothetical protein
MMFAFTPIRHERRAEVEEENDGYGRHDQGFLEQLVT